MIEYDFLSFHSRSFSPVLQPWFFVRTVEMRTSLVLMRVYTLRGMEVSVLSPSKEWPEGPWQKAVSMVSLEYLFEFAMLRVG